MKFSSTLNPIYFNKISDIKNDSIKGGFWSILMQIFNFIIQIVSVAVMARFLFPEDFGLIAIVTTFIGFVSVFMEVGFSIAIIQVDDLDNDLFNNIFYLNSFVGILLTLVFACSAPLISYYFNDQRLLNITLLYSIIFFLGSLSSTFLALLKRVMDFKRIMLFQTTAAFVGFFVGMVLAYLKFGYWALVFMPIITSFVLFLFTLFSFKWYPKKYLKDSRIKNILNIGKHMTFFEFVNYFSRNLDNILIGKYFGAYDLGIYSKAYQLLMLPISQIRGPITNVALPVLSSLKNDKELFRKYYISFLSIITFLCSFLVIILYINSAEIINIVLGAKWNEASVVFSILSFAAILQPVYGTCGLVLISNGSNKLYSKWGIYNAIIMIISFCLGINYDLRAFSIFYVSANVLTFFFTPFFTLKNSHIKIVSFFKKTLPILFFFTFSGFLIKEFSLVFDNVFLTIIFKSTIFIFFSSLYFFFFYEEKKMFISVFKMIKK